MRLLRKHVEGQLQLIAKGLGRHSATRFCNNDVCAEGNVGKVEPWRRHNAKGLALVLALGEPVCLQSRAAVRPFVVRKFCDFENFTIPR